MADTRVKISVREDANKYMTVWSSGGTPWVVCVGAIDAPNGTDWIARDIPGTNSKLLMKSGGAGGGQVVTWAAADGGHFMYTSPYTPGNEEQVVIFDGLDGGFVAINNHDRSHVMDKSQDRNQQPFVIPFRWNGGWNQQWLLRDH